MITEEQAKELKKQIIDQVNTWDQPEQVKQNAIAQVQAMNPEQLEKFLIQNKLIKTTSPQCPFCSILHGKVKSYKIGENSNSLAVLEINPLSRGHTIIIPKQHLPSEKIPTSSLELAKKISETIKEKLKPKDINLSTTTMFGHGVINVIPVYSEKMPEKRESISESELSHLQEELTSKPPAKKPEKQKPALPKKLEKAPRRIP